MKMSSKEEPDEIQKVNIGDVNRSEWETPPGQQYSNELDQERMTRNIISTIKYEHKQTRDETADSGDIEELREQLERYQTSVPFSVYAGLAAGIIFIVYGLLGGPSVFVIAGFGVIIVSLAAIYESKFRMGRIR